VTGHGAQSADPTSGDWTCVPTQQMMHDGTILKTWGVQVAGTDQWIGKAHPIGASPENQAEAYAKRPSVCRGQNNGGRLDRSNPSVGRSIRCSGRFGTS
jgi:hypothetical protein